MKKGKSVFHKALVVTIALWMLSALLGANVLQAGICEDALMRCSIDAGIAALLGGWPTGLYYQMGCAIGYRWCLEYIKR